MDLGIGRLSGLIHARGGRRRRISSTDPTGANKDYRPVPAGGKLVLAELEGAGIVRHLWCTVSCRKDRDWPRKVILRAWWDGQEHPSIQCPIGDFFGVGHGRVAHYCSLPLNMVTGGSVAADNSAAMNCFFPMPYRRGARFELENLSDEDVFAFYYYLDYEEHEALADDVLAFHASYRQARPTEGTGTDGHWEEIFQRRNTDGSRNYVFVDTQGRGHFAGLVFSVDNVDPIRGFGWWGEGDDWFRIDGEKEPSLRGTGTEDYFCAAWGFPAGAHSFPYHGVSLAGETQHYSGQWTVYRFHIEDPIQFSSSLHGSIEVGHDNCHSQHVSSVAYWYQTSPSPPLPAIPSAEKLIALDPKDSARRFWGRY